MKERDKKEKESEREGKVARRCESPRVVCCRDIKIFLIRVRSGRLPCFFNPRGLFAEPLRPVMPTNVGRDVYI